MMERKYWTGNRFVNYPPDMYKPNRDILENIQKDIQNLMKFSESLMQIVRNIQGVVGGLFVLLNK